MEDSTLELTLTLDGLPEDAYLEIALPCDVVNLTIAQLLERVFPADAESQLLVEEAFSLAENPDLPEIYQHFLPVVEQHRRGLCRLMVSNREVCRVPGEDVAVRHLLPQGSPFPSGGYQLSLALRPEYSPLNYAVEQGYSSGEADLLTWLRTCAALYFLDKHEHTLPGLENLGNDQPIKSTVEELWRRELVKLSPHTGMAEITPTGRSFIGNLLSETENYIDQYDQFKDVVWDEDTESALFDSGHGLDLRVEAFILEELDPVRAVFLLRLYDGTLDGFVADWHTLISDSEFFNRVLEPVVNRDMVSPDLLERIVEQGLSRREDSIYAEGEKGRQARIARRVNFASE